ncbi:MAG: ABC transporter ATP-binding protein [Verrucomicrobiae bacterium]|nr:ABC transporter ATP-binding protein [Verrucomicrobiae bacterium]
MNAVETQDLTKEYVTGWRKPVRLMALEGLGLEVKPGLIFGFLGPNGAGKSTTIKMLLGLITPTRGEGFLMGKPIYDKTARERVGFLPEDPSFCAYLSSSEFLDLCGKVFHMDKATRRKRTAEMLALVGLTGKEKTRISEFSRGMLQRIGLAQALMNNPDLVVLDEPLNGLDPYGRKELKNILHRLKREGKTVFFSSHILSDVQEMCDEVGILNRGRMIACGPVKDLVQAQSVKLQVATLSMDVMQKIEPLAKAITREHNRWSIELEDTSKQAQVTDLLREGGAATVEVARGMETLEEFFFRQIARNSRERGFPVPGDEPAEKPGEKIVENKG